MTLSGIGFATALELAKRGARVILACRNKERAEAARDTIVQVTGNEKVVVRELDLSRLKSIRQFAEQVNTQEERVDILINNAGVIGKSMRKLVKLQCLKETVMIIVIKKIQDLYFCWSLFLVVMRVKMQFHI